MIRFTTNIQERLLKIFLVTQRNCCVEVLGCMTSGFRCGVNDNCSLLGHYAANSGNSGQLIGTIFKGQ